MAEDKRSGWLAELKPGDQVVLEYTPAWFECSRSIQTVSKITPTGRINVKGHQFLPNGNCISGNYYKLSKVDDNVVAEIISENEHKKMRRLVIEKTKEKVSSKDLLTTEQLKSINDILDAKVEG